MKAIARLLRRLGARERPTLRPEDLSAHLLRDIGLRPDDDFP